VCIQYKYIIIYFKSFKYPRIILLNYNKITEIITYSTFEYQISFKFELKKCIQNRSFYKFLTADKIISEILMDFVNRGIFYALKHVDRHKKNNTLF